MKAMVLQGSERWSGEVSEDGLYEAIETEVDKLDLDEEAHEQHREEAIEALWPPNDFPLNFLARHEIGDVTLVVGIVSL